MTASAHKCVWCSEVREPSFTKRINCCVWHVCLAGVCVWCKYACLCILYGHCVSNLLARAVDTIRAEQPDSLLHQVCSATAKHTKAQVLQELCLSRGSVEFP